MDEIRKAITKEDLLRGTKKTEKVYIKELGGEIEIRPLNEEQWAEIEAKIGNMWDIDIQPVYSKDPKTGEMVYDKEKSRENMKLKMNTGKAQKAEFEQNLLACKYGLVMDITEEELRHISPPGIIKKIAKQIYKISEVSEEQLEEMKSFRKD